MKMEKGQKEDVLNKLQERQNTRKRIITIIITLILLTILIFISFSFYLYYKTPEKQLKLGAEIEQVLTSEDGKTAHIKLKGGINEGNITKIKFIFHDKQDKEYFYKTSEGAQ